MEPTRLHILIGYGRNGRVCWPKGRCQNSIGFENNYRSPKSRNADKLNPLTLAEQQQIPLYISQLKNMEDKRVQYFGRSPQLDERPKVMIFMSNVCYFEKFDQETLVHCIYLYDRFADAHSIEKEQIYLVALVCVVISGKLHEIEARTLDMKKFVRHIPRGTSKNLKLFVAMERFVLSFFEFKIIVPTEVNFLDCYMNYALDGFGTEIFHALYRFDNETPYSGTCLEMVHAVNDNAERLMEIMATLLPSASQSCSIVAAGIMMFARREANMNFWTHELTNLTGHTYQEVVKCLKLHIQPSLLEYKGSKKFNYFKTDAYKKDPVLVRF